MLAPLDPRGLEAAARAVAASDPYGPTLEERPPASQATIRMQAHAAVTAYLHTVQERDPGAVLFERTLDALPARKASTA